MDVDTLIGPVSLPMRVDLIKKLVASKSDAQHPILFQGQVRNLSIHTVAVDLPVYRLGNGRTLASQQEYIVKEGKQEDFFSRDPESAEALKAQHIILKGMVNEAHLLDFFRKHKQIEPLILTQEGYVVNGNRRLCAMRVLLAEDPTRYEHFKHVRVVVLPPSSDRDIDELEAQLQIQPDIKADYTWVDKAMLLRDRLHLHNWSISELARVYQISPAEVRAQLDMLDHADQYLISRGSPREYTRVKDQEFAFKQLQKLRKRCEDEADRDAFTNLCYTLIDDPDNAGERLYSRIRQVWENRKAIYSQVKQQAAGTLDTLSAVASSPTTTTSIQAGQGEHVPVPVFPGNSHSPVRISETHNLLDVGDGIVDGGTGAAAETRSPHQLHGAAQVANIVSSPGAQESARVVIQDVLGKATREKQQRKTADFCLKQIAEAHTCLATALAQLNEEANLVGVETHLRNIEHLVQRIRTWMGEQSGAG